jgi:hypothetical protein
MASLVGIEWRGETLVANSQGAAGFRRIWMNGWMGVSGALRTEIGFDTHAPLVYIHANKT